MPKTSLNDARLRSLPVPEHGQADRWDLGLKGFGVRVSQGGTRTFVLNIDNSRRTIGRYGVISLAEARDEAKRILAERTLGRVRPQHITFPQARDEFLAEKKATRRASTYAGLYRFLHLYFPFKGALTEATYGELARRLNKITAPSEKNHAVAAAKVFFTWCVRNRYLADNPTTGLSLTPRPSRARVLSSAELKAVWIACDDADANLPEHFRTIVKLLILTGQRRSEIAALRADYTSTDTCTLPASLTKNGREHTFPLGQTARTLLASLTTTGLYFRARGRQSPFNGWSKAKVEIDNMSGVSEWTLHDLRRTFATNLAQLGTPIHVVEKLLNHVSGTTGGLVGVYQRHQYWDEQVKAMELWESRLAKILA